MKWEDAQIAEVAKGNPGKHRIAELAAGRVFQPFYNGAVMWLQRFVGSDRAHTVHVLHCLLYGGTRQRINVL